MPGHQGECPHPDSGQRSRKSLGEPSLNPRVIAACAQLIQSLQGKGEKGVNRLPDPEGVAIGDQHRLSIPLLNPESLQTLLF